MWGVECRAVLEARRYKSARARESENERERQSERWSRGEGRVGRNGEGQWPPSWPVERWVRGLTFGVAALATGCAAGRSERASDCGRVVYSRPVVRATGAQEEGGECVGWRREMEDVERQHTARWPEAVRRAGRRGRRGTLARWQSAVGREPTAGGCKNKPPTTLDCRLAHSMLLLALLGICMEARVKGMHGGAEGRQKRIHAVHALGRLLRSLFSFGAALQGWHMLRVCCFVCASLSLVSAGQACKRV